MLARSQLHSIESTISKELTDNKIRNEDFMAIINGERNFEH